MRAMAVTTYGQPLEPIDVPEPTLREGTALVQVLACGVCFSDVKVARGMMPFRDEVALPHVPGHEIVGRVIATDPPGALPEGGLFVVFHSWPCGRCPACRRGDETLCAPYEWATDPKCERGDRKHQAPRPAPLTGQDSPS